MARRYGYNSRNYGYERAMQHIREAEELSMELGGTDEDVKQYFFSLSGQDLKSILDAYEAQNGYDAREYAEKTMWKWQSGRVKMSGLVAGRLFGLLPPRMPFQVKYNLVSTLWEKYSPRSIKRIRIGPDAQVQEIASAVESHLLEAVVHYKIPDPLERRFHWLSSGDVDVQQQLLNHFLDIERSLIVKGTRERLPVLLKHLRQHGAITQRLSHKIKIGEHQLELYFDPKASGLQFEDPTAIRLSKHSDRDVGCMIMTIIIFVIIIIIAIMSW